MSILDSEGIVLMKVLISAAGSAAATTIIRHLRQLGHTVIGIDADIISSPLAKEECNQFFLSPLAIHPDYPIFLEKLAPNFDIFIPFIDEELRVLTSGHVSSTVLCKTMLSPKSTIDICTSKIRLQKFCEDNDIPIAQRTLNLPAIFKPEFGRGGRGIQILYTTDQLSFAQQKPGVIQTLLQGVEYTVDILLDNAGNWLFGLPRKRLQASGVSRIGEIDPHPAVLALAKECTKKIQLAYAVNIQIMLTDDGQPHLIEINPRFAGSSMFSVAAGFDIFDLAIKHFGQKKFDLPLAENIKKLRSIRYWQEKHYEIN